MSAYATFEVCRSNRILDVGRDKTFIHKRTVVVRIRARQTPKHTQKNATIALNAASYLFLGSSACIPTENATTHSGLKKKSIMKSV